MSSSRYVGVGIALSAVLLVFGVLFFFQYKDPMVLMMALSSMLPLWVVLGIVYVLRYGIPVRVVEDERRP